MHRQTRWLQFCVLCLFFVVTSGCASLRTSRPAPENFEVLTKESDDLTQVRSGMARANSTGASNFAELPRIPGQRIAKLPDPVKPAETRPAKLPEITIPEATLPTVASNGGVPGQTMSFRPVTPYDSPLQTLVKAVLDDNPEAIAAALQAYEPAHRELLAQLVPVVVRVSELDLSKARPTEFSLLAAQLESTWQQLSAKAALSLTKSVFCTEIFGFGRYRPLPEGSPLRPGEVILIYCELRNVPCVPMKVAAGSQQQANRYSITLRTTLKLMDASGRPVDLFLANGNYGPSRTDHRHEETESEIRDYYVPFRFTVPKHPGNYTVHIEIVDPAQGRYVSSVMPLRVWN